MTFEEARVEFTHGKFKNMGAPGTQAVCSIMIADALQRIAAKLEEPTVIQSLGETTTSSSPSLPTSLRKY